MQANDNNSSLPSPERLRQGIAIFMEFAYGQDIPPAAQVVPPADNFGTAQWLMRDVVERDPPNCPLDGVRSFALRLGNAMYPHMKLRLSRPPSDAIYLFSVDSHDACLKAPPGSPDYAALEELKKHNAQLAVKITTAWAAAGLPTEATYLRQKIRQAADKHAAHPQPPQE